MTNHIRVLTAVVLSQLIIEWLKLSYWAKSIPKIIGIVLLSTAVEAILHICCAMKYHSDISSLATSLTNFKQFIWKNYLLSILL